MDKDNKKYSMIYIKANYLAYNLAKIKIYFFKKTLDL